ncbi:MAG: 16S rRNA processing protein RimM [Clostridia bacterium]|nr:16S rRNA processing protein RimM [Clostridia bacterium]
MENIEIGIITKPQALKGQFRVKPTNYNLFDLKDLTVVIIKGKNYNIEKVILREGFAIFKVEGIDDISQVEVLRNTPIYVQYEETEELLDDEYFIEDLIGSKVIDKMKVEVGVITEVKNYGSASVITVANGDKEILFPHARKVILSFDADKKVVVIDRKIFEEISL